MVTVDYFSDVLCIWAFGGQIRVDELEKHFGDKVQLRYRFIPIFGSAMNNIEKNWAEKNGYEGFNEHLKTVASQWTHVSCHSRLWLDSRPATSMSAHVVLKAVWLLQEKGIVDGERHESLQGRTRFESFMWNIRRAFFEFGQNIAEFTVLKQLVAELEIDWDQIFQLIENGEAYAGLFQDEELKRQYCVQGSPCFVLNEGRQVLYGNVGYRIVEANINELLEREGRLEGASWC
jgi:predicted DsbA family dithiol-disulfide isomerase